MAFVAFNSFQKLAASKQRKPVGGGGGCYKLLKTTILQIQYCLQMDSFY